MSALPFLETYSGETTQQLLALENRFRIDSLVLAFEQALQAKSLRIAPKRLSKEERVVLAIESMEREVNNGGYHQFFSNPSAEFAGELVESLIAIGCPATAKISEDALSLLGIQGPFTSEKVTEALDTRGDELGDALSDTCDSRYYSNTESIETALFTFIKANAQRILIP